MFDLMADYVRYARIKSPHDIEAVLLWGQSYARGPREKIDDWEGNLAPDVHIKIKRNSKPRDL